MDFTPPPSPRAKVIWFFRCSFVWAAVAPTATSVLQLAKAVVGAGDAFVGMTLSSRACLCLGLPPPSSPLFSGFEDKEPRRPLEGQR